MQILSPRQQSILNRVVDTYIETSHPVGSRFITELYTDLYRRSYSSATVRHEMLVLEEKGYLTHPHTSAGRIPTDSGYRYYLDHSVAFEDLPRGYFNPVEDELSEYSREFEPFAEKTSAILSQLSDQISMILLPVSSGEGAVVRFRLFIRGADRILEKPEFQDRRKIVLLIKMLEEKINLMRFLIERAAEAGIRVSIGNENSDEALKDCSMISTQIFLNKGHHGVLAVLGPTRMKYSRTVPLVRQMGRMVSRLLDRMPCE